MAMLDLPTMLAPLTADAPCGKDLEYDPVFMEMLVLAAGKPEQQFGDKLIPAKPPDWEAVHEHGLDLAGRTRDLRVAMWLLRSEARLYGWPGALTGLQLLLGLLEQHWDHVHPRLDPASGDAIMRVSALAPLSAQVEPYPRPPEVLDDLRAARLEADRPSPSLREIELGMGAADALPGEMAPTRDGIVEALRKLFSAQPTLAASMAAGVSALDAVDAVLRQRLGASVSPDLSALRRFLDALAKAGLAASSGATVAADAAPGGAEAIAQPSALPGTLGPIRSREDIGRTIDRLCEWIEHHEPSNPVPLLLRRAQRLMNMNFLEIVRDIAPDGADQVTRLAGREAGE
jgi:type VI secretion system protein ImpA